MAQTTIREQKAEVKNALKAAREQLDQLKAEGAEKERVRAARDRVQKLRADLKTLNAQAEARRAQQKASS